ncbi:hypothetical protein QAD02_013703 [Eretmocerus hayati]|uniref:Uncharacterized protein n=1 Tax=Eretmocerus hayati TaxID=131215 RepID=A0ACC2P3A9_9HYME|nr:hypothetical protein QAD02_013703 [Eretmocerus hayati]
MPTKDELERQLAALREENASLALAREKISEMQRREQELEVREQRIRQREIKHQTGVGADAGADQLDLAAALLSLGEAVYYIYNLETYWMKVDLGMRKGVRIKKVQVVSDQCSFDGQIAKVKMKLQVLIDITA